jgi:hypothetical protein
MFLLLLLQHLSKKIETYVYEQVLLYSHIHVHDHNP